MKGTFTLLILLPLFLCNCKQRDEAKFREAEQAMDQALAEMKKAQRDEFEKTGTLNDQSPEALDKMIAATKKAEEAATGDDAKILKVTRLFQIQAQKDMTTLTQAAEYLEVASDYSTIKTKEHIDQKIASAKKYQEINNAITKKIKTEWRKQIVENIDAQNVSKKSKNNFLDGFDSGMAPKRRLLMGIRKNDDQLCEGLIGQLKVLKDQFGKWSWNAEDEVPDFESDAAIDAFNEHVETVQNVAAKQAELQEQLIKLP